MINHRVVRDHRQLLHVALPERESEPTSTFSVAAQLDRTIAERVVFAVWLPFISAAGAVMPAREMNGTQSEPDSRDLPGKVFARWKSTRVEAISAGIATRSSRFPTANPVSVCWDQAV